MNPKFQALRAKHPQFIFESYTYQTEGNDLIINFHFKIEPDISFTPQIIIHTPYSILPPSSLLDQLVFNLGLIESISYYKATLSPEYVVKAGHLTADKKAWWKDLFINGLSEMLFRNEIEIREDLFEFVVDSVLHPPYSVLHPPYSVLHTPSSILLPLGGGKDSLTSLLILKDQADITLLTLNDLPANARIIEHFPDLKVIKVSREIDPALLKLNQEGYLNGHTPFSAYLAFLSVLVAKLTGIKDIVLSNEHSASEGNFIHNGRLINHQYSKSLDFELKLRQYISQYLNSSLLPNYFSLLRPVGELKIAQMFTKLTDLDKSLRKAFLSCNRGQKQGVWCGECSKCLFAYLMIGVFLNEEDMMGIFGQNLLSKESLLDDAINLIHPERIKPWECVGSRSESLSAMRLISEKYQKQGLSLPFILDKLKADINELSLEDAHRVVDQFFPDHFLSEKYLKILETYLK